VHKVLPCGTLSLHLAKEMSWHLKSPSPSPINELEPNHPITVLCTPLKK